LCAAHRCADKWKLRRKYGNINLLIASYENTSEGESDSDAAEEM
jgi:hypothetical protein